MILTACSERLPHNYIILPSKSPMQFYDHGFKLQETPQNFNELKQYRINCVLLSQNKKYLFVSIDKNQEFRHLIKLDSITFD